MPLKDPVKNAAAQAAYFQKHKQRFSLYYLKYRQRVRGQMISAYGGCCVHCGEDDPIVLVLDHVNDDGQAERRWGKKLGGFKLYTKLRAEGWPKGRHQLLCHNCNYKKEHRRRHAVVQSRTG